ncbi:MULTISPECIES: RNA-binding domain-containing protein [Clostridia]|jgi:ABC-type Mn2+/Zn2+ transport system ATPase subunit|uniref:RNA-binding domain-containing protein n=1 Tax=Clostridia TaxID=186801 RepID=UPI000E54663F|nr:AAA family ATPase [Clostridium sp. AF34-10BH]RHP30660.1 ATP-binding cassette domain-containing protein [Clostridium sp. AF34-10BH]
MIIDTVEISNLGLWENLFLKFDKSINIIQGENGVGKTTLLALLYSLFHDSGIIKFTNKNQEAYICMNLHDSKEKLVLKKVYKKGQSGYFVSSFADIKKIARMEENKVFIFSGEFLDYDCQLNTKMIKNAMKLLKNVDMERYFSLAYEGVYMSQGQQSVIQILNLLYLIPSNSIILLDAPFAKVDSKIRNNLIEVMKRLKDVQIILTTTITEETEENVIYLIRTCKDIISTRPQFDYNKIFKNNMKQIMRGQEKNEEGKIIVKYMLNQEVKETEKRNIEYKEIKGSSPINAIIDVAEIYINAFLNSRVVGIGTIKWGISDKRIVKGVKLSKDDQDVISRKIAERVGQMKPYVSSDCVEVIFQNIADESKIIEELYAVEVVVKSWTNDILFSTSKGEVYIKTEGGKKKLDAYGIQEELRGRLNGF